jgi:hypothetical protein
MRDILKNERKSMSITSVSAGSLLGRSFSVTFGNSGTFILINMLISIPILLWSYFVISPISSLSDFSALESNLKLINNSSIMLGFVSTCLIAYGVFRSLRGEHTSLGMCFEKGGSSVLPSIGAILIIALWIIAAIVGLAILTAISKLFLAVGSIVLAIFAVPLFMSVCIAIPAIVTEKLGSLEGIKRSRVLTEGYKWTIFWSFFLFGIIKVLVEVAILLIFFKESFTELDTVVLTQEEIANYISGFKISSGISSVVGIVFGTLSAVMPAVIYHDLRAVKDGLDDSQLTSLFD